MTQNDFDLAWLTRQVGFHHREDVRYIQHCAREDFGITLSDEQAKVVWQHHSESMCAGWLGPIDSDSVRDALQEFIKHFTKT